jgi:hypothetical protein
MKSAVAALGLFAVMANAYHHPRHFHFRRDNNTASGADLTTLTVIATQVQTVTSCAPTVTNCPARPTDIAALPESEKQVVVITNTLVLTETVCPVSEVPAISSSVISEADAGKITGTTLTAPLTPSATPSGAPSGVPSVSVPLGTGVTTSAAEAVTTAAPDSLTTLTVIATQVSTVISCAPTVTNCPARPTDIEALPETQKQTVVVTNTVILTETVCPVSEVPAISSSVISEADAGKITGTTLTAPQTTAAEVTTSKVVETKSLTFTQGTGSTASIVTSTYLTTIVHTVPCNGGCGGGEKTKTAALPVQPSAEVPTAEPTTTTTATSTGTTTVTVPKPGKTEQPPAPGKGEEKPPKPVEEPPKPAPGKPGQPECECAAPATVTVTAPASTVYVTMAPPAATNVSENASDEDDDEFEDEDDCVDGNNTTTLKTTVTLPPAGKPTKATEAAAEPSATGIVTTSIVPIPTSAIVPPYPIGGGKNSTASGVAAPTGFAHRLRI